MKKKIKVISEIGENFLGDIKIAKKLVSQSQQAGATYAKFQSYNERCLKPNDPEYKWFKKVSLSDHDHIILKKFCDKKKINFMSSPFSIERAEFLSQALGLSDVKIASSKIFDKDFLKFINLKFKKVFLSTGMATLDEIRDALNILKNTENIILHCVSEYPLPYRNANLSAISLLQKKFPKYEIGYSDHTIGNLASIVAISLGATVIEKHFTFNRKAKGTDHILSADYKDLKNLIRDTDLAYILKGRLIKTPSKAERKIKNFMKNRFVNY